MCLDHLATPVLSDHTTSGSDRELALRANRATGLTRTFQSPATAHQFLLVSAGIATPPPGHQPVSK